ILASPVFRHKILERFLLFLAILFIASWAGSKGPVLTVFIIYVVSYATFRNLRPNFSSIFRLSLFALVLMSLVYFVVLFQYPYLENFSLFLDYLSQRVFVAQLIGVYEEFNLH